MNPNHTLDLYIRPTSFDAGSVLWSSVLFVEGMCVMVCVMVCV